MWIYKEQEINSIEDVPENAIGFIYKITNLLDNKFYIGKKQLNSIRKTRISKREQTQTNNKRKKFKQIVKDSGWLNYNSSCKELQQDIINLEEQNFKKEIIEFCFNKRDLNYKEVWWQFKLNVLEENTYNNNIAARWFRIK